MSGMSRSEPSLAATAHCRVDLSLGFYSGMKPTAVRLESEALLNPAWRSHPHQDCVRYQAIYQGFQAPATCSGLTGGDIHGIDEWVSITSMQQVSAVLALFMARWCGVNPCESSPLPVP